jgi:hypothetical protein
MAQAESMDDVTALRIRTPTVDEESGKEYIIGQRARFGSKSYEEIVREVKQKYHTIYNWMGLVMGILTTVNMWQLRTDQSWERIFFSLIFSVMFLYAEYKAHKPSADDITEMLEHELVRG